MGQPMLELLTSSCGGGCLNLGMQMSPGQLGKHQFFIAEKI